MRFVSASSQDTEILGESLGRRIQTPMVVALRGALGTGKTAFTRGLARGLDVPDPVTSPTFALVHEHMGRLPLFHFDLFRLTGPDDLFDIGWEDYLNRGGVCVVEWCERAYGALPPGIVNVALEFDPKNTDRRIIVYDDFGA